MVSRCLGGVVSSMHNNHDEVLEVCKAAHQRSELRLRELGETIYGNGREGLVTRMAKAEAALVKAEKNLEELMRKSWQQTGFIAAISFVASIIVAVLVKKL